MFQVGRYDPNQRERPRPQEPKPSSEENDDKKRPLLETKKQPHTKGLRVIAPDESGHNKRQKQVESLAKNRVPVLSEAIDDLDLLFVDGDDPLPESHEDQDIATEDQLNNATATELDSALKWSKQPLKEAATAFKMAPFLIEKLRSKYETFFPVQAWSIIQVLWQFSALQERLESDICITAPTGSGKTLAYGLPILHSLSVRRRRKRQLRALIVLPSRDLAQQVYQVFQEYCDTESNLRVGLAIGQSNFKAEQIALTVDEDAKNDMDMSRHRFQFETDNLELALKIYRRPVEVKHSSSPSSRSNVDVLVCTPGRLVDHLDRTPGFSLQLLEFLVVDEADRLLNQRYHNWMDRVFESVENPLRLRKFLVSATMTRDPRKLAPLRLVNPKHFDGHNNTLNAGLAEKDKMYSMPDSLQESTIECTAEQKPLVLLALLLEILPAKTSSKRHLVIVFTSSVDSTHRLTRLLQLLWTTVGRSPRAVVEFSSASKGPDRAKLLQQCNDDPSVQVLVCSDGLSRGMDIKDVGTVIHYDVPSLAKTYVHRCGRTARAGQSGSAIALLKGQGQAGQFWNLRNKLVQGADRVVKNRSLQKHLVRNIPYQQCLGALKEVLQAEDEGELRPHDVLGDEYFPRTTGMGMSNNIMITPVDMGDDEDNATTSESSEQDSHSE